MNKTNTTFTPGKLFKGTITGAIVMCTNIESIHSWGFTGVVINPGNTDYVIGTFNNTWNKDVFEVYSKPITITSPKTLELTLEDIADKFGVGVGDIKIVKN